MEMHLRPAIRHLTGRDILTVQDHEDVLSGKIKSCTTLIDYIFLKQYVGKDWLSNQSEEQVRVLLKGELGDVYEEVGDDIFRQFVHDYQTTPKDQLPEKTRQLAIRWMSKRN